MRQVHSWIQVTGEGKLDEPALRETVVAAPSRLPASTPVPLVRDDMHLMLKQVETVAHGAAISYAP